MIILIADKLGQSIYHESMSMLNYRRKSNFAGMEYGQYHLVVTTADRKEKFFENYFVHAPMAAFPGRTTPCYTNFNGRIG